MKKFFIGLAIGLPMGILVGLLVVGYMSGLQKTFGPLSSSEPVRYSWDSGRKCVVVYPNKQEVPCAQFTKEELNQFRLEYTNPHREKK